MGEYWLGGGAGRSPLRFCAFGNYVDMCLVMPAYVYIPNIYTLYIYIQLDFSLLLILTFKGRFLQRKRVLKLV